MDMKKILQALDSTASKPVEGVDSMSKFLRVVNEAELNQPVPDNIEDLGNGAQKRTKPDGTYEIGDGTGLKLYSADGKLLKIISPSFAGFNQETDVATGNVTKNYSQGVLSTSQTTDKAGKVISHNSTADIGSGVLGYGKDQKGITTKSWAPRSPEHDSITQKDLYAVGNKDKEATYNRAMAQVKGAPVSENSLDKFLSIVKKNDVGVLTEGKGPLNRLTAAEAIAINHYTDSGVRKDITSPVLNVALGAKPSMLGKYFKSVEEELEEQSNRSKERAKQIAERVASKINETPRKSAQVKLQQAWEREQAKSTASRQRADQAKAEFEKDWKAKQEKQSVKEAEGTPEGVPHLTKELLTHIVQQSGKEGAHAVVKSLEWGDGASKELLHLIIDDLKDDIKGVDEVLGFMVNKTPNTSKSSTSLSTMRKEFEKDKSSTPSKTQRGQDEPKNAKYVRTTTDEAKKKTVKESTDLKKKNSLS